MAWKVQQIRNNPIQNSVVLVNDDLSAALTTDYHEADKLARSTLTAATLESKYYDLSGHATRVYVSQAY